MNSSKAFASKISSALLFATLISGVSCIKKPNNAAAKGIYFEQDANTGHSAKLTFNPFKNGETDYSFLDMKISLKSGRLTLNRDGMSQSNGVGPDFDMSDVLVTVNLGFEKNLRSAKEGEVKVTFSSGTELKKSSSMNLSGGEAVLFKVTELSADAATSVYALGKTETPLIVQMEMRNGSWEVKSASFGESTAKVSKGGNIDQNISINTGNSFCDVGVQTIAEKIRAAYSKSSSSNVGAGAGSGSSRSSKINIQINGKDVTIPEGSSVTYYGDSGQKGIVNASGPGQVSIGGNSQGARITTSNGNNNSVQLNLNGENASDKKIEPEKTIVDGGTTITITNGSGLVVTKGTDGRFTLTADQDGNPGGGTVTVTTIEGNIAADKICGLVLDGLDF